MRRSRSTAGGVALTAAVATMAVSLVLAAAVAEVGRTELVLVRSRRVAAAALAAADACLAQAVANIPPGWDFATLLAGSDGITGTADDGVLALPGSCSGHADTPPGPALPSRVRLRVEGQADGGRRAIEALVGRAPTPGVGALAWLDAPPPGGPIAGAITLDGADRLDPTAPPLAAVAAPVDPGALDVWVATQGGRLGIGPSTVPPVWSPPPPLPALATRVQAAGPAGAEVLVPVMPAPSLAYVAGDLVIADALSGAGLLYVAGTLDIRATLHFTGVVVAAGGIRVAGGSRLTVEGTIWIGSPTAPASSLQIDGLLELFQDRTALAAADARVALPRRAVVLGIRDLG